MLITLLPSLFAWRRVGPQTKWRPPLQFFFDAWLSMCVVGLIVVLFVVFLCSGFRSPLSPLLCFITEFLIICVSLWCFTDETEDPYAEQTYIYNLGLVRIKGEVSRASKTGLRSGVECKVIANREEFAHLNAAHPGPSHVVFLLTVPRRYLCFSSSLFVHLWFQMCVFCNLFLISPSFGGLG